MPRTGRRRPAESDPRPALLPTAPADAVLDDPARITKESIMVAAPEDIARELAQPAPAESRFFRLLDKALPHIKRHLPYNRFCDNLYHRLLFLKKHRRWPGKKKLWND